MPFAVDANLAVTAGTTLYENRAKLLRQARRLVYQMTRGTLRVAVFGPGGAGKTTLGQLLSGGNDSAGTRPSAYQESIGPERHPLPTGGDVVGGLIVPPGQERRRDDYWPDLYRNLVQGRSAGVINVVSYGYHSFGGGLGWAETQHYRQGMTTAQFLAAYLEARRASELEIIKGLAPRLADAKRDIWMITLVTKQDLWWNDRAAVERYYREGEYGKRLAEITQKRGALRFPHEFVSASLVMSNFVSGKGELLAPTTGGYDQNIQQANLRNLIEQFQTLAKRKT